MKSLSQMIADLQTLKADDLSVWETGFMATVNRMAKGGSAGPQTAFISGKQAEVIERLWKKHFEVRPS
jgi:hypothetical protein